MRCKTLQWKGGGIGDGSFVLFACLDLDSGGYKTLVLTIKMICCQSQMNPNF